MSKSARSKTDQCIHYLIKRYAAENVMFRGFINNYIRFFILKVIQSYEHE